MAQRLAGRFGYPAMDDFGGPFRPGVIHPDQWAKPGKWKKPRRVFVCSMGDLFHNGVCSSSWADNVFAHMALIDRHTYLLLTKRPANMGYYLKRTDFAGKQEWPFHNVWIGVTAENQKRADERIPELLGIPAAVRWVSLEPLLGPIDLHVMPCWACNTPDPAVPLEWPCSYCAGRRFKWPGWVVVGCESGPKRRPCKVEWVRDIVEQCRDAGVPCFVKQLDIGGKVVHDIDRFPEDLRVREYPQAVS